MAAMPTITNSRQHASFCRVARRLDRGPALNGYFSANGVLLPLSETAQFLGRRRLPWIWICKRCAVRKDLTSRSPVKVRIARDPPELRCRADPRCTCMTNRQLDLSTYFGIRGQP
jgi:hypothetical protein